MRDEGSERKKNIKMAERIARAVEREGGSVYYVGGYVRDKLRGVEGKDVDIEVHGITPGVLEEILDSIGQHMSYGESFGVYGMRGCSLDIAMPRKEKKRGTGHRDFEVFIDPFIGSRGAAVRRDFTINALMQNVLSGEIIDEFCGMDDLRRGIIRHVSDDTFSEDPLRVLRAAQFAARFEFEVADETLEICRGMNLEELAKERVMEEVKKALLKARHPSVFFEILKEMGQLSLWFPEAEALIGIRQNPDYHLEGDVWNHSMLVLDAAREYLGRVEEPVGFMLAALAHDFGKAVCTEEIDGVIHAYDHVKCGMPLARSFIDRLTNERKLAAYTLNLVKLHMHPNIEADTGASVLATNRTFDQAIDAEALLCLAIADGRGKIAPGKKVCHEEFLRQRLDIYREYMERPYVMGKDLIEAGLCPGEEFSDYLKYAHQLRLAGVKKEEALARTLSYAGISGR